ncbi:MAG: glycosyltransferase [Deltaproteobacteria bacterium]
MRVVHTLSSMDNEAAGPSYSVPRLCEALIGAGVSAKLAVLDWVPGVESPPYVERFPIGAGPRRLGRSPTMARWLIERVKSGEVEVLHNHGLWMMPNVYPGWSRKAGNVRLVVSPRGTLSEWALNHHALRKWFFWHLLQAQALRRADAFHATAESEYEDLRRIGFRQPVAVLPIGIEIPPLVRRPSGPRRRLLYLGRIHKKKGIDLLLRAWRAVQEKFPDWEVVIAGPDDGGELPRMQKLAGELGVKRVSFPGPAYGEEKFALYRSASLYVLPAHSENFGITVAEALAAGTPAIVTHGAPWAGLVANDAGWWIEIGIDPLVACFEEALALPEERLADMGRRGREWMAREFSWEAIGRRQADCYAWLCGRGSRPACMREN